MAQQPDWLAQVRAFCKQSSIEIMGWGEETLVVKAVGTDQATKVANELRSFGFEAIEDENDAEAGMLLLSRDRAATLAKMKK
jgi:phosphosulfolactate synthase (CoM biosynthesis protein A)